MFNVQWKSHEFYPDGRPRTRPPASSVHGWLKKWQGTFAGDEDLRTKGMREMREAAARRSHDHNTDGRKVVKSQSPTPKARELVRHESTADHARSRSVPARPDASRPKAAPSADASRPKAVPSGEPRGRSSTLTKAAPSRRPSTATTNTTRSASTKTVSSRPTTTSSKPATPKRTATQSRTTSPHPGLTRRATEPPRRDDDRRKRA